LLPECRPPPRARYGTKIIRVRDVVDVGQFAGGPAEASELVLFGNFLRTLLPAELRTRLAHSGRLRDVFPSEPLPEERSVIHVIVLAVPLYPDRGKLRRGDKRDFARGNNDVIRLATESPVDAFVEDR
jgi:hypothetical protein